MWVTGNLVITGVGGTVQENATYHQTRVLYLVATHFDGLQVRWSAAGFELELDGRGLRFTTWWLVGHLQKAVMGCQHLEWLLYASMADLRLHYGGHGRDATRADLGTLDLLGERVQDILHWRSTGTGVLHCTMAFHRRRCTPQARAAVKICHQLQTAPLR
ncbi:hypothetical protein PC128_g6752 [Phytophthora cactorum]|nr:hypothetical protein PC128_g6752 [Phytophthora cactorum]